MVISQRNGTSSVTPTDGQYTLDRWVYRSTQASKVSIQQNAGAITPPIGFTNYLGATSLSAYSITADDFFNIRQLIEGFNIADLGWGTANAKTVTLSFWVYSSLTGTFGGALNNGGFVMSYPFTYSIPTANTWTQISVTIAGPTSGTFDTNNSSGFAVSFNLGIGSSFLGTAGSWASATYLGATGGASVVGTNGATFYITGVQLEVGSNATGFEYVNYQTSLANCQRYFEKSYDIATAVGASTGVGNWDFIAGTSSGGNVLQTIRFTVSKRATGATITGYNDDGTINQWKVGNSSGTVTTATPTFDLVGTGNFRAYVNSGQGNVIGRQIGNWTASSEL
jgi:hypothetical protein